MIAYKFPNEKAQNLKSRVLSKNSIMIMQRNSMIDFENDFRKNLKPDDLVDVHDGSVWNGSTILRGPEV